jgi:hypothetical protein
LQFRGSFSQLTGCACPNGNCEDYVKTCSCAATSCTVEQVAACVDTWESQVCTGDYSALQNMISIDSASPAPVSPPATFLQISFGEKNFLSNTSQSADGAVGMPGYVFFNPLKNYPTSAAATKRRDFAFANNKALTTLVQIDAGAFVNAEWNWEKEDSRCKRCGQQSSTRCLFSRF